MELHYLSSIINQNGTTATSLHKLLKMCCVSSVLCSKIQIWSKQGSSIFFVATLIYKLSGIRVLVVSTAPRNPMLFDLEYDV
jgi:uncharacterized membrane protein